MSTRHRRGKRRVASKKGWGIKWDGGAHQDMPILGELAKQHEDAMTDGTDPSRRTLFMRAIVSGTLPDVVDADDGRRRLAEELRESSLATLADAAYRVVFREVNFDMKQEYSNNKKVLYVRYGSDACKAERVLESVVALYEDASSDLSASYWIDNRDRTVLQTGLDRHMWKILGDVPIDTLHDRVGAVADHYNALTLLAEAPHVIILESEREKARADRANHMPEYAAAAAIIHRLGLKKFY